MKKFLLALAAFLTLAAAPAFAEVALDQVALGSTPFLINAHGGDEADLNRFEINPDDKSLFAPRPKDSFQLASLTTTGAGKPVGNSAPVVLTGIQITDFVNEKLGALAAGDKFIMAVWLRGIPGGSTNTTAAPLNNKGIAGNDFTTATGCVSAESCQGIDFVIDNSTSPGATARLNGGPDTGNSAITGHAEASYGITNTTPGVVAATWEQWTLLGWASETGSKRGAILKMGTQVADMNVAGTWSSNLRFNMDTHTFYINQPGLGNARYEIAQFVLAIPASAPLDNSNAPTISPNTFVTAGGLPIASNSTCSNFLGYQPDYCFDSTTAAGFFTNKGFATPVGMLSANTYLAAPTPASINVNETAAGPYMVDTEILGDTTYGSSCTQATGATGCAPFRNYGAPIAATDMVVIEHEWSVSTSYDANIVMSGWTRIPNSKITTGSMYHDAFYCIGCLTVAAGVDMTSPTFTWTPRSTDAWYGGSGKWSMKVFRNVNQTTPILASQATQNSAANALVYPTLTATAAGQLLVCSTSQYDYNFEQYSNSAKFGPPDLTKDGIRYALPGSLPSVSGAQLLDWDERVVSAGSLARSGAKSAAFGNVTNDFCYIVQ